MQRSSAAILQSGNLFMYVMHNPVMFTDPSGMVATPMSMIRHIPQKISQTAQSLMNIARTATKTSSSSPVTSATSAAVQAVSSQAIPWDAVNSLSKALPWLVGAVATKKTASKTAAATSWIPFVGKAALVVAAGALGVTLYQASSLMPDVRTTYNWMTQQLTKTIEHMHGRNSVYVIRNIDTNLVHYVGRTVNFEARRRYHQGGAGGRGARTVRFPSDTFNMSIVYSGLSLDRARALEQALIAANVLLVLDNKINSIAEGNLDAFAEEFRRLQDLMGPTPSTP